MQAQLKDQSEETTVLSWKKTRNETLLVNICEKEKNTRHVWGYKALDSPVPSLLSFISEEKGAKGQCEKMGKREEENRSEKD